MVEAKKVTKGNLEATSKSAPPKVATSAEVGEWLGISAQAVAALGRRGVIGKVGPRGYVLKDAVRKYAEHLRQALLGRGGADAAATAAKQRARLAKAQADMVEQKVRRAAGELLDAGEVEREWSGVLRTVKAGMLAIPSRCGARLPHLGPHDISTIDGEVRAALAEVAVEDNLPR